MDARAKGFYEPPRLVVLRFSLHVCVTSLLRCSHRDTCRDDAVLFQTCDHAAYVLYSNKDSSIQPSSTT